MTYYPNSSNTGPSWPPSANSPSPTGQLTNEAAPLGTIDANTGRSVSATFKYLQALNAVNIGKQPPIT